MSYRSLDPYALSLSILISLSSHTSKFLGKDHIITINRHSAVLLLTSSIQWPIPDKNSAVKIISPGGLSTGGISGLFPDCCIRLGFERVYLVLDLSGIVVGKFELLVEFLIRYRAGVVARCFLGQGKVVPGIRPLRRKIDRLLELTLNLRVIIRGLGVFEERRSHDKMPSRFFGNRCRRRRAGLGDKTRHNQGETNKGA